MLKTITKVALTLSTVLLLSACSDQKTNQGDQDSITNRVTTYQYVIPEAIKTQINQNTEKIIITELVTDSTESSFTEYNDIIANVASYINSVNDVMTEQGYTIISSDTNGIGSYGSAIVVTLIFENKKN